MRVVTATAALVVLVITCMMAWTVRSFSIVQRRQQQQQWRPPSSSSSPSSLFGPRLYNVPPPAETDVEAFAAYASKQSPPASFFELQQDCVRAVRMAREDGEKLVEVEFPPLPAAVLEQTDVSSYDVTEANLRLVLEFAKGLLTATSASQKQQGDDSTGDKQPPLKQIAILLPDEAEAAFCIEKAGGSPNPFPGVTISSLLAADPADDRSFKPENVLLNLFGSRPAGVVKAIPAVDLYVVLTASAQELPDVEELHSIEPSKTIVLYNLKLDTLRGDLGAPAFPGKDFQDRFLSRVKPVYYLRTRQYTRSTAQPPFVINYQGCIFRTYPGEYQTLLDTGTGRYRRLCGSARRPALGEFKEQLTQALRDQGIIQEESAALNFLRTGYKTATWWEEDRPGASDAWRT